MTSLVQEHLIAGDFEGAAYRDDWRDQIYEPEDPKPGDPVFGTDEDGQGFFEFVRKLQQGGENFEIAAFTESEAKALENVSPGALIRMNAIRAKHLGLGPIKIIPNPGVQLPKF